MGTIITGWYSSQGGPWQKVITIADTDLPGPGYVGLRARNGWLVDNYGGGSFRIVVPPATTDSGTGLLKFTPSGVEASPFPYGVAVLDDFNRDNEIPLGNGTWTQGRQVTTNPLRTYTQNAGSSVAGFAASRWTPGTFLDTVAYVDLVIPPSGTTDEWCAIYARQTPDANHSAYEVAITRTGASTWKAEIFDEKGVGHVFTQRAVDTTTTWASGDKLGIRVTGSGATVTVELWRYTAGAWQTTPLLTWNDTAADRLVTAGEVELEIQGTTARVDNFGVPSAVGAFTDAATVPLLFTPSATEFEGFVEANVVALTLAGSSAEALASTDSSTSALVFTPNATEVAVDVEAATVQAVFTVSGTDVEQAVDTSTTTLVLTTSGTEFKTGVTIDLDTASLVLTTSGTDAIQVVEAATTTLLFTTSGTEFRTITDASTGTVLFTPNSTDIREIPDSNTVGVVFSASGADVRAAVEAATAAVVFTLSALEGRESVDASATPLALTPLAGDALASTDSQTSIVVLAPSAVEVKESIEANVAAVTLTPSYSEALASIEASVVSVRLGANVAGEALASIDTATVQAVFRVSGTDFISGVGVDAGTATVQFAPTTSEIFAAVDANAGSLLFSPSASVSLATNDASTVPVVFSASSTDVEVAVEAATGLVAFTVSGTDAISGAAADAGTVKLLFTQSATELRESVEASTLTVLLSPGGAEVLVSTDFQTIPINLQVAAIEATTRVLVDAGTGFVLFTVSGTDVYTAVTVDIGTISLQLTPFSTDITGMVESGQVDVLFDLISTDFPVYGDISEALLGLYVVGDERVEIGEIGLARLIFSISAQDIFQPAVLAYALEVARMYAPYRVMMAKTAYSEQMYARSTVTVSRQYEHVVPFKRYWWRGNG
jgi:hypothetical protein